MTRQQKNAVTYNMKSVKDLIRFIRNLEARGCRMWDVLFGRMLWCHQRAIRTGHGVERKMASRLSARCVSVLLSPAAGAHAAARLSLVESNLGGARREGWSVRLRTYPLFASIDPFLVFLDLNNHDCEPETLRKTLRRKCSAEPGEAEAHGAEVRALAPSRLAPLRLPLR